MTERSYHWDGTTLGDATLAPYSAAEFGQTLTALLGRGQGGAMNEGWVSTYAYGIGAGLVTGTSSPVSVAQCFAFVRGFVYWADAAVSITIPTPAANPRIDRIVLRADHAAQTVRAVRLAGSEAATPSPPALTQVANTTWEVSLAQVYITTGGVITIRDERLGNLSAAVPVLFRDIWGRALEEYFDNFYGNASVTSGAIGNTNWFSSLTGTGVVAAVAGVPSSISISSGATNGGICILHHGSNFPTELAQAPLLFEWRATPLNAAADAQTGVYGRLANSGGTQEIAFGVRGASSTANLVVWATNAGTTAFVTGQAIDTSGAYHKMGLYVPASGGPVIAFYDDVAIGQVAANLPASGTDLRVEHVASNGTTATARSSSIDYSRLVRGA